MQKSFLAIPGYMHFLGPASSGVLDFAAGAARIDTAITIRRFYFFAEVLLSLRRPFTRFYEVFARIFH